MLATANAASAAAIRSRVEIIGPRTNGSRSGWDVGTCGVSFRAAKTARNLHPICTSVAECAGFLAVFAARNDTRRIFLRCEQILHLVHEPALRRRLGLGRRVALEQFALRGIERCRDPDVDVHVLIAAAGALQVAHALAAQA